MSFASPSYAAGWPFQLHTGFRRKNYFSDALPLCILICFSGAKTQYIPMWAEDPANSILNRSCSFICRFSSVHFRKTKSQIYCRKLRLKLLLTIKMMMMFRSPLKLWQLNFKHNFFALNQMLCWPTWYATVLVFDLRWTSLSRGGYFEKSIYVYLFIKLNLDNIY